MLFKGKISSYPTIEYNEQKEPTTLVFNFYIEDLRHIQCILDRRQCKMLKFASEYDFQVLITEISPFTNAIIKGEKMNNPQLQEEAKTYENKSNKNQIEEQEIEEPTLNSLKKILSINLQIVPDFIFEITEFIIIDPDFSLGTNEIITTINCPRAYWLKYRKGASKKYRIFTEDALKSSIWGRQGMIVGNVIHNSFLDFFNLKKYTKKTLDQLNPEFLKIFDKYLADEGLDLVFYLILRRKFQPALNNQQFIDNIKLSNLLPQVKRYLSNPIYGILTGMDDFESEVSPDGIFSLYGQIDLRSTKNSEIIEIKTTRREKERHMLQLRIYQSASITNDPDEFENDFLKVGYIFYTQLKDEDKNERFAKIENNLLTFEDFLEILNARNVSYGIRNLPIYLPFDLFYSPDCKECQIQESCRYYCATERRWVCEGCGFLNTCLAKKYDLIDPFIIDKFNDMRRMVYEAQAVYEHAKKFNNINSQYQNYFYEIYGLRTKPLKLQRIIQNKYVSLGPNNSAFFSKIYNFNPRDIVRIIRVRDGAEINRLKLIQKTKNGIVVKPPFLNFFNTNDEYILEKVQDIEQKRAAILYGIDLFQRKIYDLDLGLVKIPILRGLGNNLGQNFILTCKEIFQIVVAESNLKKILFDFSQGCISEAMIINLIIELNNASKRIHLIIYSTEWEHHLLIKIKKALENSIKIIVLDDFDIKSMFTSGITLERIIVLADLFVDVHFLCLNSRTITKNRLDDFFVLHSFEKEEPCFERIVLLSGNNIVEPIYFALLPLTEKFIILGDSHIESRDEIFPDSIFNIIRNTGIDLVKEIKFQNDFSFKIYTPKSEYNYLILSCNFAPFILPELETLYQNYNMDLKSPIENAITQMEFINVDGSELKLQHPDLIEVIESKYGLALQTRLKKLSILIYALNFKIWLNNYEKIVSSSMNSVIEKCFSKNKLATFSISDVNIMILEKEEDTIENSEIIVSFNLSLENFEDYRKNWIYNPEEVDAIEHFLSINQIEPSNIAIASPFPRQVEKLREKIWNINEFKDICIELPQDLYNQSFKVLILSMVVSNEKEYVDDFILEISQIYEIFTHSTNRIIVFGNAATLSKSYFFNELIKTTGRS